MAGTINAGTMLAALKVDDQGFESGMDAATAATAAVAAAVVALAGAILDLVNQTAKYRDEVTKASRASGTTVKNLSALQFAAEQSGLSLQELTKHLGRLTDPATQKKLSQLGIQFRNNDGTLMDSAKVMDNIADRMAKLPPGAERASLAMQIFGQRGAQMVNLLGGGSEGIKKLTDQARAMGIVFDKEAGEAAERFNDSANSLKRSVDGLIQSLSGTVIKILDGAGAMKVLEEIIQSVTMAWNNLDEETKEWIVSAGIAVTILAGIVAGVIAIIQILPILKAVALAVMAKINIATAGIPLLLGLIAAGIGFVIAKWESFKGVFQPLVEAFGELKKQLMPIIDAMKEVAKKILPDMSKAGGLLKTILVGAVKAVAIVATVITRTAAGVIKAWEPVKIWFEGLSFVIRGALIINPVTRKKVMEAGKTTMSLAMDAMGSIARTEAAKIRKDVQKILDIPVDFKPKKGADKPGATGGKGAGTGGKGGKEFSIKDRIQQTIGLAQTASNAISGIVDNQIKAMEQQIAQAEFAMGTINAILDKQHEMQVDRIEETARKSIQIEQDAMLKRIAMIDEEFARRMEALDQEFERRRELELMDKEQRLVDQEERAQDDIQELANRLIIEKDFQKIQRQTEKDHEKAREALLADTNNKKNTIQETAANETKRIEEDKNKKIDQLNKQKEEREKASTRAQALIRFAGDVAGLEMRKRTETAGVVVNTASAIMSAISSAMQLPFPISLAVGALLTGLITAQAASSIATINSQQVFPPVGMLLKDGGVPMTRQGVMRGPGTGTSDLIPAMLSNGESHIVDSSTTDLLGKFLEEEMLGGTRKPVQSIVFEEGSVLVQPQMLDDEGIDMLTDKLGERVAERLR